MNRSDVESLLREHAPTVADRLLAGLLDCVDLTASAVPDDEIARGASKLGGDPDLPAGLDWPHWATRESGPTPLSFLAQIDLAALPSGPVAEVLPSTGVLSFFVDEEDYFGLDPEERDGFRLLLLPSSGLERRAAPEGATRFRSGALRLDAGVSLPQVDDLEDGEYDAVDHVLELMMANRSGRHQLLGYPFMIQNPPAGDVVHTFGEGRPEDWSLLLQIDSDDELGMCWGDVGTYYLMVPRGRPDPTRAWCVFQCS